MYTVYNKINKLVQVTSCFGMWELMTHLKVWIKKAFHSRALLNCTLWEWNMPRNLFRISC